MKTAPFEYSRPATLDEACALLAADPDSRLIAGGQTLVPMMAMRLARPSRLIDIQRITELAGIREDGDVIAIGAVTRQVTAERSALVAAKLPLLAAAIPWIGHAPTRARGTVGGSIANADPAAEIPLVLATLGGHVVVQEGGARRAVSMPDLVLGPMTTSVPATGCIVEAQFPVWKDRRIGVGFHEVSARKSDFAYVAVAAQVALDEAGRCTRLAVGIGGATPVPTRLDSVETSLKGETITADKVRAAMTEAIAGLEIMRDSHASDAYRRRVAIGLAGRAILDAVSSASSHPAGSAQAVSDATSKKGGRA